MVSTRHVLAIMGLIAAPVFCQPDWAVNFYTTGDCEAAQPHWARLYYGGYSGKDNNECIVLGSNAADCSVTYSGTGGPGIPGGVSVYSCTGPNSKGLSGAPLKGFEVGGSCDFYTDSKCTKGHVHHNPASHPGLSGPEPVCFLAKTLLNGFQYVGSFKCTNA